MKLLQNMKVGAPPLHESFYFVGFGAGLHLHSSMTSTSWCLTELLGQISATSSLRVTALSQHRVENFPQPPSHLATLIFVWETQPSSLVMEIRWGIRVQFSGATPHSPSFRISMGKLLLQASLRASHGFLYVTLSGPTIAHTLSSSSPLHSGHSHLALLAITRQTSEDTVQLNS